MPDRVLFGVLAFFSLVIAGRFVHERGLRTLSADEKAAVLDSHAGIRKYSLLAALPIIILGFYFPRIAPWLILAFFAVLLTVSYRRLGVSHLPHAYRRSFAAYAALYVLGVLVFFGLVYFLPQP